MEILLFTGSQAVSSYSTVAGSGDTSRSQSAERTSEGEQTFAMYLYTNGAGDNLPWNSIDKISLTGGSESLYDTILGISITDITNTPPPSDATEDMEEIIGAETDGETADEVADNNSRADVGEFYARIANAAPFSVDDEKVKETQFGDMYVKSSAYLYAFTEEEKNTLSYEEYIEKSGENLSSLRAETDSLCVPVGAGELAVLMDNILNTIAEGGSLAEALQNQIDKHGESENPQSAADLIWVNPYSGEVTGAYRKERELDGSEWTGLFDDDSAVLRLADDLASFIRYAVFASESDDPERAAEFILHLKNKQAYADYGRYIADTDPLADIERIMELIIANLTAAGVIGGENDELEQDWDESSEISAVIAEDEEENDGQNGSLSPQEELNEILDSIGGNKAE